MKKITLLFIALLSVGTMLMAQGGPRRGEQRNVDPKNRAERMTERMAKEYSLTDAQKAKVYDVNLAMAQQTTPLRKADANVKGKPCCANCDKCANCANNKNCKVAVKGKKGKHARNNKMGERPSKEDREKMMAEMKKSREDYNAKIEKIFTKEQFETYTKNQAERQKRMGERPQRGERPQPKNS